MRIWKIFLNLFVGVPFSWILMCTPLLPNSIKLVSRPTHWPAWCSSHQALRASSIFRSGHFLLCAPRSAISSDMMNSWMNQETHLRFSLYICIFRKLICRFLSVFLLPQSLLDMNCVTLILSQLDEQRQRGRTLTQADTVRHCLWAREQTLYHLCDVDTKLRMHIMSKRLYAVYTFRRDHASHLWI